MAESPRSTKQKSDAEERAAYARRMAAMGEDRLQNEIDALLVERRGYVERGLADRVAQVDDQIRFRGGKVPSEGAKPAAGE